ncbi:hypothetical protein PV341_33685 [Streptomyces sp. PA03-1a]|nr:hypothetical protein [Streptomyces sp. PA03-1a]
MNARGMWFCGAAGPWLSEWDRRVFQGCQPSYHMKKGGNGRWQLRAVLSVPVPGHSSPLVATAVAERANLALAASAALAQPEAAPGHPDVAPGHDTGTAPAPTDQPVTDIAALAAALVGRRPGRRPHRRHGAPRRGAPRRSRRPGLPRGRPRPHHCQRRSPVMPCSCQSKREQFEVVATSGKVVFTSGNKATAETVATRYPDSEVRKKAPAGAKTAAQAGGS